MKSELEVKMPEEIVEQLWTRYLPETTYILLGHIGKLKTKEKLLDLNIKAENNISQVIEEKKSILSKLKLKYPENRQDDLDLLMDFKLIEKATDENKEDIYVYSKEIKSPTEVLDIDDQEKQTLKNIKFEMSHEQALNMMLTLLLNNNGNLNCSVDHILKATMVKLTEIKKVLDYLANKEKSIDVVSNKAIGKLKKQDKVYITLDEEVFNEKRIIV